MEQLSPAAQAAGPDNGPPGQITKEISLSGNQGIPGIFPPGDGSDNQSRGKNRGQVFHAVNR